MRSLIIIGLMIICGRLASQDQPISLMDKLNKMEIVNHSGQAVLIMGDKPGSTYVRVTLYEKRGGHWLPLEGGFPGVIGRNGFAAIDRKRDYDEKTPSGVYNLSTAFGYAPSCKTWMPYQQSQKNDYWVVDPKSSQYNSWVRGKPKARNYVKMLRNDKLYRWGIVVEYNTRPAVPGKGSAVFLHVWYKPRSATTGGIAFSEADMLSLLAWLDPAKQPIVVLGRAKDLWDYAQQ